MNIFVHRYNQAHAKFPKGFGHLWVSQVFQVSFDLQTLNWIESLALTQLKPHFVLTFKLNKQSNKLKLWPSKCKLRQQSDAKSGVFPSVATCW